MVGLFTVEDYNRLSPAQGRGGGREDDVVRHEDCLFETVPHIPPSQSAEQVKCGRESLSDSSPLLKHTAGRGGLLTLSKHSWL